VFLQNSRCRLFSRFIELLFIENSVNRVYGTMDRVHARGSPRSTGFIKPWPSALGSTAQIKSIEGVSTRLIVVVGSGSDDGETLAEESGGALGSRWWLHGTLASLRFSAYGAPNRAPILPTTPHWQEELDPLTFRWQLSTGTSGSGCFFVATLVGVEELLRSTFGFKNRMRSLPVSTSYSYAGSMAPIGDK
jgi:hypothetical protein